MHANGLSFRSESGPMIIAHRGGALEAPENTVGSVRHGVAVGAAWQEIDVQLSRDGQVVVIHDETLERTTSGSGRVSEHTLEELVACYAGTPGLSDSMQQALVAAGAEPPDFAARFSNECVPAFGDILGVAGSQLMVELKSGGNLTALIDGTAACIAKASATNRVVVGSFDPALTAALKSRTPHLHRVGIAETADEVRAHLDVGVSVLAVRASLLEATRAVDGSDTPIWCWTVRDVPTALKLARQGPDGISTDIPGAVMDALALRKNDWSSVTG